jgi:hypothetical protein
MYILLLHAGYLMPFASATSSGWLCHGMSGRKVLYCNHQTQPPNDLQVNLEECIL